MIETDTRVWHYTVLNLPEWLTTVVGDEGNQLRVKKSGGSKAVRRVPHYGPSGVVMREEISIMGEQNLVFSPEDEEVVLYAPKAQWMVPLTYQDVMNFGKWRQVGGPKYDEKLGVNTKKGEPLWIVPISKIGEHETVEQPSWKRN